MSGSSRVDWFSIRSLVADTVTRWMVSVTVLKMTSMWLLVALGLLGSHRRL
jgi:hypothetical protein